MTGSSSISIKACSDTSGLLLFWDSSIAGCRARFREGIVASQQQKASVLPVWSSSGAETLVKGVVSLFEAIVYESTHLTLVGT